MITLIALALLVPADTPIEPIPASAVELALHTDAMAGTCDAYGLLADYVLTVMSTADAEAVMPAFEQWSIDQFEEGWEEPGTSARMTDEAEDLFVAFLRGCL